MILDQGRQHQRLQAIPQAGEVRDVDFFAKGQRAGIVEPSASFLPNGFGTIDGVFYLDLFRVLQQEDVRYLVVGGLAVNLYGVERATMDVDVMLAMDKENVGRFLRAARALGLKPVAPVALELFAEEAMRSAWFEQKGMIVFALRAADPAAPTLDVLIRPQLPFDEAWARRVEKSIGGLVVRLASLDDLIRMKAATGRQRDRSDIEALEKARRLADDDKG